MHVIFLIRRYFWYIFKCFLCEFECSGPVLVQQAAGGQISNYSVAALQLAFQWTNSTVLCSKPPGCDISRNINFAGRETIQVAVDTFCLASMPSAVFLSLGWFCVLGT